MFDTVKDVLNVVYVLLKAHASVNVQVDTAPEDGGETADIGVVRNFDCWTA